MDFINLNFEVRNKNLNSDDKKDKKTKKDISHSENIPTNLAKPTGELLKAYSNVVSFKGDAISNLRDKYKAVFSKFNSVNIWEHFRNTLCAEYSDLEVDTLLTEISAKSSEDSRVFNKFYNFINVDKRQDITYSDGIQNPETKKQEKITLPRALTPIEAKELIINDITKNADVQKYYKLVDEEGFDSKVAQVSIKYGFSENDRNRLETLLQELFNGNRTLTQDEAITCIAYGFEETELVQTFIDKLEKEYSGNKLDLFEAALCTAQDLDDSKVEKFFELKSKQLNYKKEDGTDEVYVLSTQEAILCAKAELDEDELKRYVELKNKSFMYTAVREHNSAKNLSSELIISYIKKNNTDEEIAELAKYDFKDFGQYEDFKSMLKVYGFKDEKNVRDLVKQNISYIAKLQDENGNNIFKNENGEFILHKFKISQLTPIRKYKLTPSQARDYIKFLTILKSMPNRKKYDIQNIAVHLAKLEDENGRNLFEKENGEINFDELGFEDFTAIGHYKLNSSQMEDYIKIRTIIESTPSYQKELGRRERMGVLGSSDPKIRKEHFEYCAREKKQRTSFLAAQITKFQDENGKTIFKNENGEFDFGEFNTADLSAIAGYKLTLGEIQDYIKLKKLYNLGGSEIAKLIKLQDENGKNIFKKENGEFDFGECSQDELSVIQTWGLTSSQIIDYIQILPILKSMPNDWLRVEIAAAEFAKLQDEDGNNVFKNENGEFDFDGFTCEEIERMGDYKYAISQWQDFKITKSQFKDFKQILPILKSKFNSIKVLNIAAGLATVQDEDGNNVFKNENGEFDFDRFTCEEIERMGDYNYAISQWQDFKITKSQFKDFKQILPILKSKFNDIKVLDIAAGLAMLQDEDGNNVFKNENGEFDFDGFAYEDLELMAMHKLTKVELQDYKEILPILKLMSNNWYVPNIAAELAKLQDENGNNIFKKENGEFDFSEFTYKDLEKIVDRRKSFSQYDNNYKYLITTLGVEPENAIYIAQNEDLMGRFRLVNPNIFWQGATGENKQVFDLFNSLLVTDDISGSKLKRDDIDFLPEEHSFNNGVLSFNPKDTAKQGYSVALQKAIKNNTSIMIVKNQNGERENYIVYDGAIALLRPLQALSDEQKKALNIDFSTHPHFSLEEINALEEAARHFIINIIEENGECIISKGIDGIEKAEPFIGKELNTDTTKEKFKEILQKLHKDSSSPDITIENILRLMPKDAMLNIRPYATSKSSHEILYSISAEWEDKDGTNWELRVHSEDLKHIGKHWIYRLGYEDSTSTDSLYYDNNQNDFIAGSTNPDTHIFVESPEDYENKLISNPYFQKAIRNISISFNKTQIIDAVASELNIHTSDKEQKKNEIIEKCQQNAGYYYKYKNIVDNLLKEKGLFALSESA